MAVIDRFLRDYNGPESGKAAAVARFLNGTTPSSNTGSSSSAGRGVHVVKNDEDDPPIQWTPGTDAELASGGKFGALCIVPGSSVRMANDKVLLRKVGLDGTFAKPEHKTRNVTLLVLSGATGTRKTTILAFALVPKENHA